MYSRSGMVVTSRLKQSLTNLAAGLVGGSCLLFGPWVQAREAIEILYEHTDSVVQPDSTWWWVINLLLVLGVVVLSWLYNKTRKSLKEKELILERTAERLQEAQTIARIGSWERDFESGETFWSSEAKAVLGFDKNNQNLKHYEALVHPDDLDMVTEAMASAYFKGGSYQCDHRIICANGSEKYIRLAGRVFLNDSVSPVRETATVQDITERKLAELAVQESECRLSSILNAVPYPIIILEAKGRHSILYSNERARSLFAFNQPSEIEAFDSRALWKDVDAREELLADLEQQQAMLELRMEMNDCNDNSFWALVTANNMDFGGSRSILLSIMSLSESKQLEQDADYSVCLDLSTGLHSRRSFFKVAEQESRRAQRYNQSFALLVMGIDGFKAFVDEHGNDFGDQVLMRFCALLRSVLQEDDILGRLGDEEFCALLVASDHENSRLVGERIRHGWQKERFDHQGTVLSFTVSIGVAVKVQGNESLSQILDRAYRCWCKAKQAGCNQVVLSSHPRASLGR